jgi:hypothetical protein
MPGITTAFAQGLAANRPAAATSNAGWFYYATDSGILSQSTGSSWVQVAAGSTLDSLSVKGDLLTRSSSAYARLGSGSDGQVLTADSTQTLGLRWATPAAASLSTASAQLGADVTLGSANTYYDGPSVSLAAGTWLLVAALMVQNTSSASDFTGKLWDGTTVASSGQVSCASSYAGQLPLCALVTPGSTTTYKVSVACSATGGKIKAAATNNPAGNTASTLVALKVA